jgi:hypothetical protein
MTETNSKNQAQPAKKTNEHPASDELMQFGLELEPMPTLAPAVSKPTVEKSVVERLVQKMKEL